MPARALIALGGAMWSWRDLFLQSMCICLTLHHKWRTQIVRAIAFSLILIPTTFVAALSSMLTIVKRICFARQKQI
jgi:hypothetical protein